MSNVANYYDVLGINKMATNDDIKKAHIVMVKKWHPDKHQDKARAECKFKLITQAYKILSDPAARRIYDEHGISHGDTAFDPFEGLKEGLENLFESDNDVPNVICHVEATTEQLYVGIVTEQQFIRYSLCDNCNGTGSANDSDISCRECGGNGNIIKTIKGGTMGHMVDKVDCHVCDGAGIDPDASICGECEGEKYIKEMVEYELDVPAGAYNEYSITLEGEGNFIPTEDRVKNKIDTERTNVLFVIREIQSQTYKRGVYIKELKRCDQSDVLMDVNISFGESICGVKKKISYMDNEKICIAVDDIIMDNELFVLENYGMPQLVNPSGAEQHIKRNKRGDLFIRFKINKPKLTKTQRKRIWQIVTNTAYPMYEKFDMIKTITHFDKFIKNNE